MKKLITKEYVNQIQFYQLPKDFFHNPKYMQMKLESKVAYTLLMDLLPLSIQNNWVNEKGQVFVKLSRKKLMALLNVKGTQKAAQIMKELVDNRLIVNKRIGLTKCNEIYLYPLDALCTKKAPKTKPVAEVKFSDPEIKAQKKPDQAKPLEAQSHQVPAARPLDAMAEVQDLLTNQIHIEDLKEQHDPGFVDEIGLNICEMFLNTTTPIGQQDKPMSLMRSMLRKLKMHHIEHVIAQFREVASKMKIYNPKKYLQTMIYNSVFEANTAILGDIRYNFGYC